MLDFTFLCTFVSGSEKSTDGTFVLSRERKFHGAKVLGTFAPEERKFHGCESSWTFRSTGANVSGNESSTETKVPSVDFSLPGTKVQRNEKSRYPKNGHCSECQYVFLLNCIIQVVGWLKYNRDDWIEVVKL